MTSLIIEEKVKKEEEVNNIHTNLTWLDAEFVFDFFFFFYFLLKDEILYL